MTTGSPTGGLGKRASGDFDLNLAPIIDCFTVLIAYLLVSASFISLAVLDAGIAAKDPEPAPSPAATALNVEIQLETSGEVVFRVTGAALPAPPSPVPAKHGGWDLTALARRVESLRRQLPGLDEITISAAAEVPYKEVVRAIEVVRKIVPKVYLAG